MLIKDLLDEGTDVRLSCLASFSSLAFSAGVILKLSCALRAIKLAGRVASRYAVLHKNKSRGEVVMFVALACLACLIFGVCAGFLVGGICANASDKQKQLS
jgi:hypothetical protein